MANTFTSLSYHIVFSTKCRYRMISDAVGPELHRYIASILKEQGGQPLEINGVEDHVHILTSISPRVAVADVVRLVKSNASKWFNENHASKFGWQTGYAAFTVSQSQQAKVQRYVAHQQEHHRSMPFRDEYLALLRKHRIAFDERYVFEQEHTA